MSLRRVAFLLIGAAAALGVHTSRAEPQPTGRASYLPLLRQEAAKAGLPWDIADAVTAIESGYDPTRIGGVGEIGLMQIRPGTAAMLGFSGSAKDLMNPAINIHFGVTYLAGAWQLARGDLCRTLMKYRAGHGESEMTARSSDYCARAQAHLASVHSSLSVADFVPSPVTSRKGAQKRRVATLNGTALRGQAFWAAHDARVRAITARVVRRWRQVASR